MHHPRIVFAITHCNNFSRAIKSNFLVVMITWPDCDLTTQLGPSGSTRHNPALHLDGDIDELHKVCKGLSLGIRVALLLLFCPMSVESRDLQICWIFHKVFTVFVGSGSFSR